MPQFSGHGTREGVLKKLAEAWPADDTSQVNGTDRNQIEALRSLISAEIGALDSKINGVRVIAECAAHERARTLSVTILPQDLSV